MDFQIIRRLRPAVKLTPVQARILDAARREVVKAGDLVRELDAWRRSYTRRSWYGRAA